MQTFAMVEMETIRWIEANRLTEMATQVGPVTSILQHTVDLFDATIDTDKHKQQLQVGYIMQSLTLLCDMLDCNLTDCYAMALRAKLDAEKQRAQLHVVG